ncbi:MAG: hypothetical protein GY845_09795, partial [Planctomycetes bacterium]|nr:hypothetical protein [Planctomycetota bacterium]
MTFADPGSSYLNHFEITNPLAEPVVFLPCIAAKQPLSADLTIPGDLSVINLNLNLNGYTLTVSGNLIIGSKGLSLNGGRLDVAGSCFQNAGSLQIQSGHVEVMGDYIQSGGTLKVQGGALEVQGDYRIQRPLEEGGYTYSSGHLYMTDVNDHVLVHGAFVMDCSTDHDDCLTSGVLELKGNFEQLSSYYSQSYGTSHRNFNPTGSHKVLFSGGSLQTVTFADPGSSYLNHF